MLMAWGIRTMLDWLCTILACLSFAQLLRVGEASCIRPVNFWQWCALGFYDESM